MLPLKMYKMMIVLRLRKLTHNADWYRAAALAASVTGASVANIIMQCGTRKGLANHDDIMSHRKTTMAQRGTLSYHSQQQH